MDALRLCHTCDFISRFCRATSHARDKVAACDFVALTNQTITTDYDILASGLVLVDCLAKRKP